MYSKPVLPPVIGNFFCKGCKLFDIGACTLHSCTNPKYAYLNEDMRTATEIRLLKELQQTKAELDGYKELLMKIAGKTICIQDEEDIPAIFKDIKDKQIKLLKEEIEFLKESRCPHCEPRQCYNHDKKPVEVYIEPFCRIKNEHQKYMDVLIKWSNRCTDSYCAKFKYRNKRTLNCQGCHIFEAEQVLEVKK